MKNIILDGNKAASNIAYNFTEVAGIYPITPSSPMAANIDSDSSIGKKNIFGNEVKVVEMQSEAGAAGVIHGSLEAGSMATTFTASQGLLLMIPTMYKIAGEMLPSVIHVAARTVATHALSIFGDHSDVYATRDTGYVIMASQNVQDASNMALISHLSTYEINLPILHFFDGFRTSHEINKINELDFEDYKHLINFDKINEFKNRGMINLNPTTRGTAQNEDIYFTSVESRNKYYMETPEKIEKIMEEVSKISGINYKPFVYYGHKEATKIIIAMGSCTNTAKEVVDKLNKQKEKVGLIIVYLFRPFSVNHIRTIIPKTVKKIAVLDRSYSFGQNGEALYLDVRDAFFDLDIEIIGGHYGLSSRDTIPNHIKSVFDHLDKKDNFSGFSVGIEDDVSFKSIEIDNDFTVNNNSKELKIFGYGSDGMVSASKSLLKLIGDETNKNVQGYFRYDSKKSGGITIGNLRVSDNKINSTYYVNNPDLVVCSKEGYLGNVNVLENIKENSVFLLNTIYNKDEIIEKLPNEVFNTIIEKKIKFYIINAYKIALKAGLGNRINTILLSSIFKITNLIDYDFAKEHLKKYIEESYKHKGMEIVKANYNSLDMIDNELFLIDLSSKEIKEVSKKDKTFAQIINDVDGYSLKVSDLEKYKTGVFKGGNTKFEKRDISNFVPSYNADNCIQCNFCSLSCPHGVIRPFLMTENQYQKAPEHLKNRCKKAMGPGLTDYYFTIGVSEKDCTGCEICTVVCPGKGGIKALTMDERHISTTREESNEYLFEKIENPYLENDNFSKYTQFRKPLFEFSGACAGCGETAYIKLLTQITEEKLVIANATGCSSIYGGSTPSFPYSIPWANSLFENNAEFAMGIYQSYKHNRESLISLIQKSDDELIKLWLENSNDLQICKRVYSTLDYSKFDSKVETLKEYFIPRNIWSIGGDGWAYDIGFSGIDHILASNENINILVLDTEVYSNTGGQASKSTKMGAIAEFAASGKKTNKKDLARIAMTYDNVYVAEVSLGANREALVKAFKEANDHNGPSIIIAYAPCISHGIKGGLKNSISMEFKAVECGYKNIYRYNPNTKIFTFDQKEPNFDLTKDFVLSQNRFSQLKIKDEEMFNTLIENQTNYSKNRYEILKKKGIKKTQ
ncbi:MAG: pyruvate:ferredoxin (flavodoxin) oxidoreductase [Bacilli bacterium]